MGLPRITKIKKEEIKMSNEEKYKLALFMVIRNSKIMPQGLRLGKSMTEINHMAVQTMSRVIEIIDYDNAAKSFEEGLER